MSVGILITDFTCIKEIKQQRTIKQQILDGCVMMKRKKNLSFTPILLHI